MLAGNQVGRWVGIVAAALECISAIWLMPFYPVWGFVYLILGVLVIYALAAYGGNRRTCSTRRAGQEPAREFRGALAPAMEWSGND